MAAMASRASYMTVIVGNRYQDTEDIEVIDHHMLISLCPSRRRYIGPVPFCSGTTSLHFITHQVRDYILVAMKDVMTIDLRSMLGSRPQFVLPLCLAIVDRRDGVSHALRLPALPRSSEPCTA